MRRILILGVTVLALSACADATPTAAPATASASSDCDSAGYRREVVDELGVLMSSVDLSVIVANHGNGWEAYRRQMIAMHDDVIARANDLARRTIACGV